MPRLQRKTSLPTINSTFFNQHVKTDASQETGMSPASTKAIHLNNPVDFTLADVDLGLRKRKMLRKNQC